MNTNKRKPPVNNKNFRLADPLRKKAETNHCSLRCINNLTIRTRENIPAMIGIQMIREISLIISKYPPIICFILILISSSLISRDNKYNPTK